MYQSSKKLLTFYKKVKKIKNSYQQSSIEYDFTQSMMAIEKMLAELKMINQGADNLINKLIINLDSRITYDADSHIIRVYIVGDRQLGKTSLSNYLVEHENRLEFIDTPAINKDIMNDLVLADCVLYLINPETIYFQKEDYLVDYLKSKPAIGILNKADMLRNHVNESGLEGFIKDAKKYYSGMFEEVLAVSVITEENLDDLLELIEKKFLSIQDTIAIRGYFNVSKILLRDFHHIISQDIQELRVQDNNRLLSKSDYKALYENAMKDHQSKLDMAIKSYELDISRQIKTRLSDIITNKDQRRFVEEEIFMLGSLGKILKRLEKSLNESMTKFLASLDKYNLDLNPKEFSIFINPDTIDLLNIVELNMMIKNINEGGLFGAFTKKKRLGDLETSLYRVKDDLISSISKHIERIIETQLSPLYERVFEKLDQNFEANYCDIANVGPIIRLMEQTLKTMDIGDIGMTLTNIIHGRVK